MHSPRNLDRYRLHPINQVAALKLRQAKVDPLEKALAILQLMKWELTQDHRGRYADLLAALNHLEQLTDAQQALTYLLTNIPGGQTEFIRQLLRSRPRYAARMLLDQLDMRLKASVGSHALPTT